MSKNVEGVKKSYPYSGKKFKCPYCGKKFKGLNRGLKQHIRKKHYKVHLRMVEYSILYWLLRRTLVSRSRWVALSEWDLKSWITSWSILYDALDELEEKGLIDLLPDPYSDKFELVALSEKLVEILVRDYEKAESK